MFNWCCGLPHYERNQYLGYYKLLKQQLAFPKKKKKRIRGKKHNPSKSIFVCFTSLVGDFHDFFMEKP